METYTEQEAAAKLQKIIQLLTDGTLAARKLSQPLDAALRPKVLTEALQPFEAATITGTADGLSLFGAYDCTIETPYDEAIKAALGRFYAAWRGLISSRIAETKPEHPAIYQWLDLLNEGFYSGILGCSSQVYCDKNGEETKEKMTSAYFKTLQHFKGVVSSWLPTLATQPAAQIAQPPAMPDTLETVRNETEDEEKSRIRAAILMMKQYTADNMGLEATIKKLLEQENSELATYLGGCHWGFTKNRDLTKAAENAARKLKGWLKNPTLTWPRGFKKLKATYKAKAARQTKRRKNK